VPLTSSLYVKGKLADREKVIVDVGTGFYVEKVLIIYELGLCVDFWPELICPRMKIDCPESNRVL
jgi:hypothetical protein